MHFYLKLANNNDIGILDVLVTETMLLMPVNSGPLPLRSQIRLILAESGRGRIWDRDTGLERPERHRQPSESDNALLHGNIFLAAVRQRRSIL